MKSLLRLGLIVSAIAFFFSVSAIETNAQYTRNRSWGTYNRQYPTWQQRRGRISPQEYRRLSRQRMKLYRSRQRAYRDGYVTPQERRRLYRQTNKYRRTVRRDRRDWN